MFNQIHEFNQLIPVNTPLGEGYLLYVCNPGMYTNGCYAVVLEDGRIRHFMDHQITVVRNDTLQIITKDPKDRKRTNRKRGSLGSKSNHSIAK
jgi:hypothetical protein